MRVAPQQVIGTTMPEPHAYARVVSIAFRPETLDQAFERFRDVSTPLVLAQPGALGIIGAGSRETGSIYAISFWQTHDDLERSNAHPPVVEALTGYADLMAGPFAMASYDVVSGALPEPGREAGAGEWARLTSVFPVPEREADVTAALQERLAQPDGDARALLLAPHVGNRLIAFELWTSRAALVASDVEAQLQDQRLWRSGALQSPPRRETLEVFGHF